MHNSDVMGTGLLTLKTDCIVGNPFPATSGLLSLMITLYSSMIQFNNTSFCGQNTYRLDI